MFGLLPHPSAPPAGVTGVSLRAARSGNGIDLLYRVAGGPLLLPALASRERADLLWQTTCFELFVRQGGGPGYREVNLSPSTRWASYAFDGHRAGMRDAPLFVHVIEGRQAAEGYELHANVHLEDLDPDAVWRVAISAVIEERDGTRSLWALAHPPGEPDFHHEACFAADLPPAG